MVVLLNSNKFPLRPVVAIQGVLFIFKPYVFWQRSPANKTVCIAIVVHAVHNNIGHKKYMATLQLAVHATPA